MRSSPRRKNEDHCSPILTWLTTPHDLPIHPSVRTTIGSKVQISSIFQNAVKRDLPQALLYLFHRLFTNCDVNYFGSMMVKVGRHREKRWSASFTCLTSRTIHIEVVTPVTTNSAIMVLRRIAPRRGWQRTMYSDNGINFCGADQ